MKAVILTLSIMALMIGSAACAFAVPQAPRVHPETPTWIADVRRAELPASPAPTPLPVQIPEVATEPISYTEVALAVNNLPQPSSNPAPVQMPVQTMVQDVASVTYDTSDTSWYDKVEKFDIGNSYIADDRERFDFHVSYRPVMANGQLAPVPEPSSIVGLAAPLLGSLIYWKRRRSA